MVSVFFTIERFYYIIYPIKKNLLYHSNVHLCPLLINPFIEITLFILRIDVHYADRPIQFNRFQKSTTSCQRFTTKQSNISFFFRLLSLSFTHYLTQLLTTLNLNNNKIVDSAEQHLANALQQNHVISFSFFSFHHSLTISHRHSPH